jgi:hypothetical protein
MEPPWPRQQPVFFPNSSAMTCREGGCEGMRKTERLYVERKSTSMSRKDSWLDAFFLTVALVWIGK